MYSELNKVITCRSSLSSIYAIYVKTADVFSVGFSEKTPLTFSRRDSFVSLHAP